MLQRLAKARPEGADVLPWWHPAVLVRDLWNLCFSAALGAGIGFVVGDLLGLLLAAVAGGEAADWAGLSRAAAIGFGLFVFAVTFISYQMDDKAG